MSGYDVTNDLRALSNPTNKNKIENNFRQPWNNTDDSRYHVDQSQDNVKLRKISFENLNQTHKNYGLPTVNGSGIYARGESYPHNDNPRGEARVEELINQHPSDEYSRMKEKYRRDIAKQNERIRNIVDTSSRASFLDEDLDMKKQAILNRINKLKYGVEIKNQFFEKDLKKPVKNREVSESVSNMRENIPSEYTFNPIPAKTPKLKNLLKKNNKEEYFFNTKVMTEKIKQKEYEERRNAYRSHDFTKWNKMHAKKVANPNKKAQEALEYETKFKQHNSESKNMIIEKVKSVDAQVELENKRRKYVKDKNTVQEEPEEGYFSSIQMKIDIISGMIN